LEQITKINWDCSFLQYEAKVYPLDLMQDVISQLAENPAYKILLLEEEERNRNFRCAVKLKDNVINVAGK
jgi:hypothetical protein